jgi:hypothetical protein
MSTDSDMSSFAKLVLFSVCQVVDAIAVLQKQADHTAEFIAHISASQRTAWTKIDI